MSRIGTARGPGGAPGPADPPGTGVGSNAHSTNAVGENLYSAGSSDPNSLSPVNAVTNWYAERQNFLNHTGNSGHYTQMVSSRVKNIGCGSAKGSNKIVVVCQYQQQGNDGQPPF